MLTRLGLGDAVSFDGHYRDSAALSQLVSPADVVLLPYDSTDQVTSGVLIEAVAAGKPVVATASRTRSSCSATAPESSSPHGDAGRDRRRAAHGAHAAARWPPSMARVAAPSAPQLLWPAIAEQYRALATQLITASVAA